MRRFSIYTLVALFTVCLAAGCVQEDGGGGYIQSGPLGQIHGKHYFVLKNVEGQDVSLRTVLQQNKAVLLNFWASWCDPCIEEIPDLIRLQDEYKDLPFTILGIDVGESKRKVTWAINRMGINYPVVMDPELKVAETYNVRGIPTSLLINSEGEVMGIYHAYTRRLVKDVKSLFEEST